MLVFSNTRTLFRQISCRYDCICPVFQNRAISKTGKLGKHNTEENSLQNVEDPPVETETHAGKDGKVVRESEVFGLGQRRLAKNLIKSHKRQLFCFYGFEGYIKPFIWVIFYAKVQGKHHHFFVAMHKIIMHNLKKLPLMMKA